jgi:hypothetical protein
MALAAKYYHGAGVGARTWGGACARSDVETPPVMSRGHSKPRQPGAHEPLDTCRVLPWTKRNTAGGGCIDDEALRAPMGERQRHRDGVIPLEQNCWWIVKGICIAPGRITLAGISYSEGLKPGGSVLRRSWGISDSARSRSLRPAWRTSRRDGRVNLLVKPQERGTEVVVGRLGVLERLLTTLLGTATACWTPGGATIAPRTGSPQAPSGRRPKGKGGTFAPSFSEEARVSRPPRWRSQLLHSRSEQMDLYAASGFSGTTTRP